MPAARLNKSSQLISIQTRRPSDESLARPKIPHRSCVEATMPPKRSAEKRQGEMVATPSRRRAPAVPGGFSHVHVARFLES
jgi:hypothetical protein